jgi:hypothetical protein
VEYCWWSNVPDVDFALQDDLPWTIGQFVWTGFDYLGEPTPYDVDAWPSHSSYFGIFDLAKLKDPNAALAAVKTDSDYAVSDAVLKEINAQGGYYDVRTKLSPKTTYLVIMWATNGNLDDFAYATYTTDKLPYVWNSLGKGSLTDDVMTLFARDINIAGRDFFMGLVKRKREH